MQQCNVTINNVNRHQLITHYFHAVADSDVSWFTSNHFFLQLLVKNKHYKSTQILTCM